MDKTKCGVLYIAVGKQAIDEALHSVESLKKYSKDLSCTLLTDSTLHQGLFDQIRKIVPSKISKRLYKLENFYLSPYENTLYIDNDTLFNHDVWEMFEILDQFDLAAVQDFSRKRKLWGDYIPDYEQIPYSFPEYCSGVILFKKNSEVKAFFDCWRDLFEIYKAPVDQPSFRVALWKCHLRIHTLPIEYNVRDTANRNKWNTRKESGEELEDHLKPRIFHWRGIHDQGNNATPLLY